MKNSIIILLLALVGSLVLRDPLGSRFVINTGVILAIGILWKEIRKAKKEK